MKRALIFIVVSTLFLIVACDYIKPSFDGIYYTTDTLSTGNNNTNDTITNSFDTTKKVLLIEFTGIRCTNCPDAHDIIHSLGMQYSGKFISISFHGTSLARPVGEFSNDPDLRTEEGNQIISDFEINEIPQGMVDYFEKSKLSYKDEWTSQVAQYVNNASLLGFSITNDTVNHILSITVKALSSIPEQTRLCAYILEDSIITRQATNVNPGYIDGYVQMNVFRKAITDVYGNIIGSFEADQEKQLSLSYSIAADWKQKNLKFVIFVYRPDNGKILNSTSIHF